MATNLFSGSSHKRARHGFRYQVELMFETEEAKKTLRDRMDSARRVLAARGSLPLDNRELLSRLLDKVEELAAAGIVTTDRVCPDSDRSHVVPMLENSGIFTGNANASDDQLFICERKTFHRLCASLSQPCQCQSYSRKPTTVLQKGHVLRIEFQCDNCGRRQWWASSRTLGGRYIVNQKMVHAFTCAGVLPSQYINFSSNAGLGKVGAWYISSVYNKGGYLDTVDACAKLSMLKAIEEVKATPHYSTSGEWVITDARHDSRANAYNTTVPCLSGSTKRIVGCSNVSRTEHNCAQTREVACTKKVLPQVLEKGLNIVEVAHDNQPVVKKYVTDELKLLNSYDTWHGTKNVAKKMTKIAVGTKKAQGKTWFPELSDKRKSTKVHLYYCMKHCAQSPEKLRKSILNIIKHYQNEHEDCDESSLCKRPGYSPTKIKLEDPAAIEAYKAALMETLIYRYAESYCRCRDTFWVESFNHQLLTYLPKRIHFGSSTFDMRMNLAILDWNENVCRESTSERLVQDMRRPDRRTAMKVLVKKSFKFVDNIWQSYVQQRSNELSEIDDPEQPSEEPTHWVDDLTDDGALLYSDVDDEF